MPTPSSGARLTAQEWVSAALSAIADRGVDGVSVEPLARSLGATKGSFYWHFANREALVGAALLAWETGETIEVAELLAPLPEPAARLRVLMGAALGDRPGARVEAALLASVGVPEVRAVLDRTTRTRTGYLRHLFEELGVDSAGQRATTAFALYLGLLHLRRAESPLAPRGQELDDYVEHLCAWLTDSTAPTAPAGKPWRSPARLARTTAGSGASSTTAGAGSAPEGADMATRNTGLEGDFLESDETDVLDVDRDAVASLHDIEGEAGDEAELRDRFVLDHLEARQLGVELDPVDGDETRLD